MNNTKQTYYDVLKISPRATIQEIVEAYHLAKNAFSKDSLATYSLFSSEEVEENLKQIEEAYSILSNIHKKVEYDRSLLSADLPVKSPPPVPKPKEESPATLVQPRTEEKLYDTSPGVSLPDEITGNTFQSLREERRLSIEEVARITKIPLKYLVAIEKEDQKNLPARVYIQGFVKNLATLYRIDTSKASQAFLRRLEKIK